MKELNSPNATQATPSSADPIPVGQYEAVIIASELRPIDDASRQCAELTFQIVKGPYAGRCLTCHLDPDHPSPSAAKLYRTEIVAICNAANVSPIRNYNDPDSYVALYNRPLMIDVVYDVEPDNSAVNWIEGYSPKPKEPPADPIPSGRYMAVITEAKIDLCGWVELTFEIIEGPYAGHRLRERLAPHSASLVVKRAHRDMLYSICEAADVPVIWDYANVASYTRLYNRPLMIDVRCDNNTGNSITRYSQKKRK